MVSALSPSAILLRLDIVRLVRDRNLDSADVMLAVADLVGLTAATLDMHGGYQCSLQDRLSDFLRQVEASYQDALVKLTAASVDSQRKLA